MIQQFLEANAARLPDKIALIRGGSRVTYAELDVRANQLAHQLIASGAVRGDRVAICLENSVEAVIAIFGILKAGCVFLPLHPGTKPDKLAYILSDCSARVLVAFSSKQTTITEINVFDTTLSSEPPCVEGNELDLAALIYTSGSTGTPKGVMLTHLNMRAAAQSITTYLHSNEDDVVINVLPLSFDYGLYQVLMTFMVGSTLVLERGFAYPWALIETMQRERVTGLPLVPTLAAILLQLDLSRCALPDLRYITNTAAALPIAHIERLRRAFPHVDIYSMYGLTECKRATYLPPEELLRRPGSVGVAIPGTEAWLEEGELVVCGPHVMAGYWNRPEETAAVLREGAIANRRILSTGDLFRQDAEGYFYFVGRKDDIIKSRGEKVSPREVENVICNMPDVVEAAVIGVPDEILGEAVAAFVVQRSGGEISERGVIQYCRAHLEDFLVPKTVTLVPRLPRSANGKVDKRALGVSS